MKVIALPFGNETIELEVPEPSLLGVMEPNAYPATGDPETRVQQTVASANLESFLAGGSTALVIVNDATRPTPTETMLSAIVPLLRQQDYLKTGHLTILVATGAHRGATEAEYHQILGTWYTLLRSFCVSHDAHAKQEQTNRGTTRNGTPILLDKRLFEADRIIATGSVEPHYFAGFTGGRKAFLPGIAGYETIVANHKLALDPKAHSLALDDNPVHLDMMDALTHIEAPIFSLMSVLDKTHRLVASTAGDIETSFLEAVAIARRIFCVPIAQKADVTISVATFPMDINLYQSQKAIDNGAAATKDGGTLIMVSACREGIGDQGFADLLGQSASPEEVFFRIEQGYRLGYHKAAKMAAIQMRMEVEGLTQMPDDVLAPLFITPIHDLQKAVDDAMAKARKRGITIPKVLIIPDGCVTVPEVR